MTETQQTGWHVARVTFEAASPLSCGSGAGERADNSLARDASGLPYVPGPTLQGLLRAFHAETGLDNEELFGSSLAKERHCAARLWVSHAHVHDSNDQAVSFPAAIMTDRLLTFLAQDEPLVRDHVKLDHRHTAEDGAKIERAAVPTGARFSFELLLHGKQEDGTSLDTVISAMAQPDFRIGSSGARGYGKIKVTSAKRGFFGKRDHIGFRALRGEPLSEDPHGALSFECEVNPTPMCLTISFSLQPVNPWRSGQDGVPNTTDDGGKAADLRPTREARIVRNNDEMLELCPPMQTNSAGYVLTGSALRGPLIHRALYCWNTQHNQFLTDESTLEDLQDLLANRAELESLIGKVDDDGALASPMLVEDVSVSLSKTAASPVTRVTHVKIGANSGGAYPGALFDEEVIETERLECRIHLRRPGLIEEPIRTALLAALRDLVEGRLALGAKSYGYCQGYDVKFEHQDREAWNVCWQSLCPAGHVSQTQEELQ
jgi:CRISPR/Cas system CSM-associated protein Csm3 (group 7 of RAMP superfamily)